MAGRPEWRHGTNAFRAGVLLLACVPALPTYAAPVSEARCDQTLESSLEAAAAELNARSASSSEDAVEGHLLEHHVEAAARSVFAEDDAKDTENDDEDAAVDAPPAKAGGPTASDREPSPFRRQMYRRDI